MLFQRAHAAGSLFIFAVMSAKLSFAAPKPQLPNSDPKQIIDLANCWNWGYVYCCNAIQEGGTAVHGYSMGLECDFHDGPPQDCVNSRRWLACCEKNPPRESQPDANGQTHFVYETCKPASWPQ